MSTPSLPAAPDPPVSPDPQAAPHPHADLQPGIRSLKAAKIINILAKRRPLAGCQILEIGTGSGIIAQRLALQAGPTGSVHAVDRLDQRQVRDDFSFQLVADAHLPFAAASFDLIVSNHVIEHLGSAAQQRTHLSEIARVLRPDGLAYLAVPNRWRLVEPHYQLCCLSWLPPRLASAYLRLRGRGARYDCLPPSPGQLLRAVIRAGLVPEPLVAEPIAISGTLENKPWASWLGARLPRPLQLWLLPLMPTLILLLRRADPAPAPHAPPAQQPAQQPDQPQPAGAPAPPRAAPEV